VFILTDSIPSTIAPFL